MELINSQGDTQKLDLQPSKTKIRSERAEILKFFVDAINVERPCVYIDKQGKKKTAPKVTGRGIAMSVSHLKQLSDLYFLKSICTDAYNRGGSFSKTFFGSIKVTK